MLLHLIMISAIKLSYSPSSWKLANVIPIKKPGKNGSQPTSYRPISLLSSISKILEKLVLSFIKNHIDENQLNPSDQHGFVKRKWTVHQLQRLTNHIRHGLNLSQKQSTGMILLDVERTFDRVWHSGLIKKMINMRFPRHLITMIHNFLLN